MTRLRIVCPHAGPIATQTRQALNATGRPWRAVDVSGADTAYTRLLQSLWTVGEPFAIVEHDIVPHSDALSELAECPHGWCAYPYPYRDGLHAGLGCVRFRAEFIQAHPDAVARTWAEQSEQHPRGHWCNMDDRLRRALTAAGAIQHVHEPPVGHLNPTPSHGCI